MPRTSLPLALAMSLALTQPAWSQTPPEAGQALREIERQPLPPPPTQALDLVLPDTGSESAAAEAGAKVAVAGFAIEGNASIGSDRLLPLLSDLVGRSLSLPELRAAAMRVTRYYRAQGYPLARAYVPAQEIVDGRVRLVVLEGRYGSVHVNDQAGLSSPALAPLARLVPGEAVRAAPLERALLLLDGLPGASVHARLQPGDATGTTALEVEVEATPRLSGTLEADNYGNRYAGRYRLGGSLSIANPAGLGDELALRVLGSDEGQRYYRVGYELPVNRWGTRVGASHAYMGYELGKDFEVLQATGTARIGSVFVRQPLVVRRALRLDARLQFDGKHLRDEIGLYDSVSKKRSDVVSLGLDGNARDGWLGGGATQFALLWSHGNLGLRSAADRLVDDLTAKTRGDFDTVQATLVRWQSLTERFSLYARFQGQHAGGNLDASEKFGLGGAYGVRAYPQGEAIGDQGWLGSLELRYALAPSWQLTALVDHGEVRLNKRPWDTSENHRSLSAGGLGLGWSQGRWRVDGVAAWKLGNAQAQSAVGRSPQWWLHAAWLF